MAKITYSMEGEVPVINVYDDNFVHRYTYYPAIRNCNGLLDKLKVIAGKFAVNFKECEIESRL